MRQSTNPVAAREKRPAWAGDSNRTCATLIWVARSELNHGSTRASLIGFRVVTTESVGSTSIGDSPLGVLRSEAVSANPAHPASGMPRRKTSVRIRDNEQSLAKVCRSRVARPEMSKIAHGPAPLRTFIRRQHHLHVRDHPDPTTKRKLCS